MSLSYGTQDAIKHLCEELPRTISELAKASARREPIIIMVPNTTTPEQMKEFGEILRHALKE